MCPSSSYPHGNILHTRDNIKAQKLTFVQFKNLAEISLVLHRVRYVSIKLYVILSHV